MAEVDSIILDVKFETNGAAQQLSEVTAAIDRLKKTQKDLTSEIKKGNDADGSMARQLTAVNAELKVLTASQKSLSGQIEAGTEQNRQYGDSFNEIAAQARMLENQYKSLTKEQRNSAEGQALKDAIIQQKEALKEFDAELGNHQRNVGNYEGAIAKFFPAFGKVSAAFKSVGVDVAGATAKSGGAIDAFKKVAVAGFAAVKAGIIALGKALLANPILAVIAAALALIVGTITKLSAAMKKNDNAMTNMSKAFAIFKPIGTAIGKVFDKLGEAISRMVLGLANAAKAVGKFLEKIHLLPKGTIAAAEAAQQLVQAQDDLEESERQYTVNSAKRQKEIAKLRDDAANSKDVNERMAALKQARKLEEDNLAEAKRIAEERLRIARAVAKQNNDTTDETKNKLAELEAAAENAEAAFYNGVRRLDKEIASAEEEIEKERKERAKAAVERRKQQLATELELFRNHQDAVVAMIADEDERQYQQVKLSGEREIEALQERLKNEKNLTTKAKQELSDLIKTKQTQLNSELARLDMDAIAKRQKIVQDAVERQAEEDRNLTEQLNADLRAAYQKRDQERQNELTRRLQSEATSATDSARIVLDAELQKHEELLAMDEGTKLALYESDAAYEAAVLESQQRLWEAQATLQEEKMRQAEEWTATALNMTSQISNLMSAVESRQLSEFEKANEKKKADLDKRLAAGLISQQNYDDQVAAMDVELEKKQKEIELKQAKRNKAIAIMEAVINMALGISKAVSENPMFGGLPGSAIAATMGAIQIATIAAEPLPTAGRGRYLTGRSHAQGGIPIEAEGGEAIINKRSTAMFKPLLSAINQAGGGVKFANGGMVGEDAFANAFNIYTGSTFDQMSAAMTEALLAMPQPKMVYEEFNAFENEVKQYQEFAAL